jgi:phosphatidylserine decarboxylase
VALCAASRASKTTAMPELDKRDSPLPTTTVKWRFPSIHPEGRKYVVVAAFVTLLVYLAVSHFVGWLLVLVTIWVATFFRDPVRTTPRADKLIVAPADGLITMIARVPPPPELRGPEGLADGDYTRVSIFMSVFDVHINRSPITGRVKRIAYVPGKFVNADLDKASEDNERQHFLVENSDGVRIGFTQIAGLVARRIMAFVREGDVVEAGQRIGLIRFGSRVDVYLPAGTAPKVLLGQRSIAGETIIGEIGVDAALTGISQ